jgi:hypothetical protein
VTQERIILLDIASAGKASIIRHFKNSYVVSGMLKSAAGNLTELSTSQKDALLGEFTRRWGLLSA